jgi:hypothetical protein
MKKTITLEIPPQLEMLCSFLETTPERVIQGFINDVSLSRGSNGSDERMMATDYFLRCGHGIHLFDYDQQREMLEGLNQIRHDFYLFGNDQRAAYNRHAQKELKLWQSKWKKEKELKQEKEKGQ